MREKIVKALRRATGEKQVHVEVPENEIFGDYSSNVAMVMFGKLKNRGTKERKNEGKKILKQVQDDKSPINQLTNLNSSHEVAEAIVNLLSRDEELMEVVDKIQVAGPGFINFWVKESELVNQVNRVNQEKEKYGKNGALKGKKVIIEFTDPNPFKEFHIGHLYTNTVGESLSRIFEASGAIVRRANYQGDVGVHVAKAVWGMQKMLREKSLSLKGLEKKNLTKRIEFMGQAYAAGAIACADSQEVAEEITEINKKVYELHESIKELYVKGRRWSLEYFEEIYKKLGTKFDFYYFERDTGEVGKKIVMEYLKKRVFKKSKGAVIFPGESFGLHTRVFINKQGLPTYEAKDLGLALTKYDDFPYDLSLIITGSEVNEYFKVVFTALKQINEELFEKTSHLGHGMVRLPSGKMSSRTGDVVSAIELLSEIEKKVKEIMRSTGSEVAKSRLEKVTEAIALAAIKYSFLRVGIGKDIIFDMEKSLSTEGESGPYLQYTFARTQSVLRKAQNTTTDYRLRTKAVDGRLNAVDINEEEALLLRSFIHFPEVVADAAENYTPNLICNYLFDLASKFNTFYSAYGILEQRTKNKEQSEFRLALTDATGQILQNGLNLLGIRTPQKM